MSDVLKLRSLAEVEKEAAIWVWRLDDEQVSAQMRGEFATWLRRDPRHRPAFEELGGVWKSLDQLSEAKRDEKIATFVAHERRLQTPPSPPRSRLRRGLPWAVAASVLLASVLGVSMWLQRGNESQLLATAVGQQRAATLADGSQVQLNTNTIVETRFVSGQRHVYLRKGEAAFKVAHDPERPFLVHAGEVVVRAIGTEFNVRLRDAREVEVIVSEGKVAVEQVTQNVSVPVASETIAVAPPRKLRSELVAGQRYETATPKPVEAIDEARLSNALAWRQGAIVFNGEPLGQAVAELNRYTDARLVIAEPSLNELRVGGRFRAGDTDQFLEALTTAFPITTRRGEDGLVYIHAATDANKRGRVSRQ